MFGVNQELIYRGYSIIIGVADVHFSLICDECGNRFKSDTRRDYCDDCGKNGDLEEESDYKGFKDQYTAYYGQNWEEIRQEVLERDGYECQDCGLTHEVHQNRDDLYPMGGGLHIHHIIPAKEFDTYDGANKLDNLVALCANCHRIRENAE